MDGEHGHVVARGASLKRELISSSQSSSDRAGASRRRREVLEAFLEAFARILHEPVGEGHDVVPGSIITTPSSYCGYWRAPSGLPREPSTNVAAPDGPMTSGGRMRCAGDAEAPRLRVDDAVQERRHRRLLVVVGEGVDALQEERRPKALQGKGTARRFRGAPSAPLLRRRGPPTSPIATPSPPVAQSDHVVPVAADLLLLARGDVASGHAQPGNVGKFAREQRALEGFGRAGDLLHLCGCAPQALECGADDDVALRRTSPRRTRFQVRCSCFPSGRV